MKFKGAVILFESHYLLIRSYTQESLLTGELRLLVNLRETRVLIYCDFGFYYRKYDSKR